jgi:N-glycosylase/DNA lyase
MDTFHDLAVGTFPILILLGFWWYFMRRYRGTQAKQTDYMAEVKVYLTEHLAETRRLNENLERIAKALEKKNL